MPSDPSASAKGSSSAQDQPPSEAPIFTLVQARSDEGSAEIALIFPNGYTDTLSLERAYDNEEDELNGANYYYYKGKLAGDPNACVTATGRVGSEAVEFTILSDHLEDSR